MMRIVIVALVMQSTDPNMNEFDTLLISDLIVITHS